MRTHLYAVATKVLPSSAFWWRRRGLYSRFQSRTQLGHAQDQTLDRALVFLQKADELFADRLEAMENVENRAMYQITRGAWSRDLMDVAMELDKIDYVEARALLLEDWASQIATGCPKSFHAEGEAQLHVALTFLGRVALRRGDLNRAIELLARSEGLGRRSEETKVLGPNLALAQELADAGEREAVLHYLKAWTGTGRILKAHWAGWIEAASSNEPIDLHPRRDS